MDKPLLTLTWPYLRGLDITADGKWTAVESSQGIFVYDQKGNQVSQLDGQYPFSARTRFHVSGDELAYTLDNHLHILKLPDLEQANVYDIAEFLPGGVIMFNEAWILWVNRRNPVIAFPRSNRQEAFKLPSNGRILGFVDQDTIFTKGLSKERFLYSLAERKIVEYLPETPPIIISDQRYYVTKIDGRFFVGDFSEQKPLHSLPDQPFKRFRFMGRYLKAMCGPDNIFNFDLDTYTEVAQLDHLPRRNIYRMSHETMVRHDSDGWLRQYNLHTQRPLCDIVHMGGYPQSMSASRRYIAFRGQYQISVFDIAKAEIIWEKAYVERPTLGKPGRRSITYVKEVAISDSLITVQTNNQVEIWNFVEDKIVASCQAIASYACFDAPYLYFSGETPTSSKVKCVKFDFVQQQIVVEQTSRPQNPLYMSAYGLISQMYPGGIALMNTATLTAQRYITRAFTRHLLAGASQTKIAIEIGGRIKIFSLETSELVNEFDTPPKSRIECMDSAGTVLVTRQQKVRLDFWNLNDPGEPIYSMKFPEPVASALIIGADTLVTNHNNGTVNFWDITHITQGLV